MTEAQFGPVAEQRAIGAGHYADVAVFDIGAEIIGPGPRPVIRLVGQAFAVAAAVVIGAQA